MRISRDWLSDYVDFTDLSAEDFSELITTRVAEVEEIITTASPLKDAVVALIKKVSPHPAKHHLSVLQVNTGAADFQVVCGAPNCREGMLSAYLAPGTYSVTPGAAAGEEEKLVLVQDKAVHGVPSCGTLVSEAELGMTGEHIGILDLTPEFLAEVRAHGLPKNVVPKPGSKLSDCLGAPDTILEIDNKSVTHRPDLWCHFGFAREIAAILHKPLKVDIDAWADDRESGKAATAELGKGKSNFSVQIAPGCGCRRFTAFEITNVKAIPSPFWMKRRLFSIGAGVRNLLVDLSNYVMHDIGQPNHTYDADKLSGSVVYVRPAKDGEKFLGLDGETRTLSKEDILIADDKSGISLGGIIGGGPSAISDTTTRVLFESANFDPVRIRTTTKRQALRTDASNRFEKSASPFAPPLAGQRYVQLLKRYIAGTAVAGSFISVFPEEPKPLYVPLRYDYIRTRLGTTTSNEEIAAILTALGFTIEARDGKPALKVPYYRATRDVSIEDDIVEEVGRILGYEHVPECAPKIESVAARPRPVADLENRVQDTLSALGFSEVYNYSFMNPERAQRLGYSTENTVALQNPVDSNLSVIRTTLVPGMMEVLEKNERYFSTLLFYELGRGYETKPSAVHEALKLRQKVNNPAAYERRLLCLAYSSGVEEGKLVQETNPELKQGADFYALLSVVRRVCRLVGAGGVDVEVKPLVSKADAPPSAAGDFGACKVWMHPFRAASVSLGGTQVGVIAEVVPMAIKDFSNRAVIAEVDLELLLEAGAGVGEGEGVGRKLFKALPKYPDSFFEMSVVMPKKAYYSELEELLRGGVEASVLRGIEVVAVYEGAPLKEDEKSVSVRLSLGAGDRTLGGEELTRIQQGLIGVVQGSRFALRG